MANVLRPDIQFSGSMSLFSRFVQPRMTML